MAKEKLSALKKKADSVFSLYIRLRDGGRCYTCGCVKDIKQMQAGHYITRQCLALRYDCANVNTQCYSCNVCKHGDMVTYREKLIADYGEAVVKHLENRRYESVKYTAEDYHNIIDYFREQLRGFE